MPKIVDREQYRKKILMKSFDLFARKGYCSITIRQLAQKLKVSNRTLYHYFPSKEALFLESVEELGSQNMLNFLAEVGNPPTYSKRIENLFKFIVENEDHILKQILLRIDLYRQKNWTDISAKDSLKQEDEQTIQMLVDYLRISGRAIFDFILNFIYGLLLQRLFKNKTSFYAEHGAILNKMLTTFVDIEDV